MPLKLDDLLADNRLARLFSADARHCALQLWILQVKRDQSKENRVVYGRLLPYSYSSNSWTFSDNDDFFTVGQVKAKVTRLNLYIKSELCAELLRLLSAGRSLSSVSEELGLEISKRLKDQFGETSLGDGNQIYRPVAYLLNRDAYDRRSISSPHGSAGAFSASIVQSNKNALFRLSEDYETGLAELVTQHLNADTGLDFGGADIKRLGDLELLVFPTLDDREQSLLNVSWADSPRALVARFNPVQVAHFTGFQFRLSIVNDGEVIYSGLATAVCDGAGEFVCKFEISDQLYEWADSTELEIFGFHGDSSNGSLLCCRWRVGYVREINFQGHMVGTGSSPVKFDWLEEATRPSMSDRVKAALTVNRGNMSFGNRIGGREADPWVTANRELSSLFARLNPPKSEGRFFERWSMGNGEGRLQFVEWFRSLLAKYQQHQIVIFDPYFETAGLGLVLICAAINSDYIVFTSLPKPSKGEEDAQDECEYPISGRVNNLIASCEHNRDLLSRIKLCIYGLKEGRLHDRYVLVMGADELPVAGFHLSNSFQKAAENFPLLITPIPADVLLQVEQYKSTLVREAKTTQFGGGAENPAMRLLFDSTASPSVPRRYEPLSFIDKPAAGSVLSAWFGETSLNGLSGSQLRTQMEALGLLRNNSLLLTDGLKNCVAKQEINFKDFTPTWEVLGEVLAHSSIGDMELRYLESERDFLEFLKKFLKASFERVHDNTSKELATVDVRFFHMSVEVLLRSSYHTEQLFHPTKYAALTWSEYFAIRFLWWYAPDCLLKIAEEQISILPVEPDESEAVRLPLLSQIVSEISLSIEFDISKTQLDTLVYSGQSFLHWLGLNAVERQLDTQDGLITVISLLESFSSQERVRALGWMVNHAARDSNKEEIFKDLVAALHKTLPEAITVEELRHLIDSMLGHMRQLAWAEPWLFRDVVLPLLQSGRASTEDACEIWMQELASMLEPLLNNRPCLFDRAREGQTTNIAAFLFAYSSPERREASLVVMNDILTRQQRIVQQPLASTSNWARWDDALRVSLWILAFSRWSEFYLRERGATDQRLEQLSCDARGFAMVRPLEEWQSEGASKHGELIAFLEQVEGLLNVDGELKGDP